MNKLLFGLLLAFSIQHATAQTGNITVIINGIKNTNGNIEIGLYNSQKGFAIYSENYKKITVSPSKSSLKCTFKNIPTGTYAIAVWHDENKNKEIDKNWFGVPTEYYGFSLNKYGTFGPPDFKDVSFIVNSNQTKLLTIQLTK